VRTQATQRRTHRRRQPRTRDGFVSLGVLLSAALVGLGLPVADPIIGLAITVVILNITWQSWRTIRSWAPDD